ncbi:VWA domain-containing protein [Streptomyces sp. RB6PN25]|uniref:VWA domain-containing protein n=1 Tax=Streptomyces humicola TaxID=2953240 RepID=A0ABT1PPH5_9ACTN|nr:VWA domain-containing protein [Streptomyces humicola]
MSSPPDAPEVMRQRLEETGYLVDEGLAIVCFLALRRHRPILCEGDADVGALASPAEVLRHRDVAELSAAERAQLRCLLASRMRRLHRLARRVVWANLLKARPGYQPLAAGMAAALPGVDAFVEGHGLAALEHLSAEGCGRCVRSFRR